MFYKKNNTWISLEYSFNDNGEIIVFWKRKSKEVNDGEKIETKVKPTFKSNRTYFHDLRTVSLIFKRRYRISGVRSETKKILREYYLENYRELDNLLVFSTLFETSFPDNTSQSFLGWSNCFSRKTIELKLKESKVEIIKKKLDKTYL